MIRKKAIKVLYGIMLRSDFLLSQSAGDWSYKKQKNQKVNNGIYDNLKYSLG